MATDAGELVVKISADIADMKAAIQLATQNIGQLGNTTTATGVAMGITFSQIISSVVNFGKDSVAAFEESQSAMTRLSFFVGNDAANAFKEYADALEQSTAFSHTSVLALESQLSAYGVLPGSVKEATTAILDYAAATGKDLPEAGAVFAKAVQGQSRELKQYGLILNASDDQSAHMNQTIQFLNTRFGGMAETIKGTVVGQIDTLRNKLDSLKEAAGKDIVDAIGFWGNALKTVASALGISQDKVEALSRSLGGQATVTQLAIDKLKAERDEIENGAKALANLSGDTVQLTAAQQARIVMITRQIAALKSQATQEKTTSDAGVKGITVVETKAQQAVNERIASLKLEMQTNDAVEADARDVFSMTTDLKIQKSKLELDQLTADEHQITAITELETQKRLLTSQQSWEANASFADQFTVKLSDDIRRMNSDWVNLASGMIDSFANATAKMIVEGGKFADVIKNLWIQIAEQAIAQIIRIIAEWMVLQATTGGAGGLAGGFLGRGAAGGMINEPSMIIGLRSKSSILAGEAGPEAFGPPGKMNSLNAGGASASGGGGSGGGGGDITVNISGQFLEGSASQWQRLVQEQIIPELRRFSMKEPIGVVNRKRGALA